jgi:hypothetical protein
VSADGEGRRGLWAPLAVALLSLLSHLAAAFPGGTYYFRDFSVTFYPQRAFQAAELAAGRWPAWNPYLHQGAFAVPALYPLDLLHVFWPGPAAVSWLLTLQFPIAGLCAYALAREMGVSRAGAVTSGAGYALGGLAVSSLNLYLFLQALAVAPAVVLGLRRAAVRGGRDVVWAAVVVALSLTTLAVEFVGQAIAIGLVFGLLAWRAGLLRMLGAVLLGAGLAGVPLLVVAGLVPETARGQGFDASVTLGNELHPAALLQVLVPNLFGRLDAPAELFWGARFFTKGFPYFASLYLGPVLPALVLVGMAGLPRRERWTVVVLSLLAVWYALGERGGLAPLVAPWLRSLRFPVKALLTPYLLAVLAAGMGVDRLRQGRGWRTAAVTTGLAAVLAVGVAGLFSMKPEAMAAWMGVDATWAPLLRVEVSRDALRVAAMATAALGLAVVAGRGLVRAPLAALLLGGLVVADLARVGSGMDPQVSPAFFELLPETRALALDDLGGGRVFSYGIDYSPSYRGYLAGRPAGLGLWSFFLNRQMLAPYTNVLDRVEVYGGKDLTGLVPPFTIHGEEDLVPGATARLVPAWGAAAVSRVLSLDPLPGPGLRPLARVRTGAGDLQMYAYAFDGAWPREYVACRVVGAGQPLADPAADVSLAAGAATCARGRAARTRTLPAILEYDVELDGDGYLVMRDAFARGWRAEVDGAPRPVLRANGDQRAVGLSAGRHHVVLRYHPPGLRAGLGLSAAAAALLAMLWVRGRPPSAPAPAV